MVLESFCGIITLQVGAAMMSAVFFTVTALVAITNGFHYDNHPAWSWPVSLVILIVFIILMLVAGVLMFLAAYNESRRQSLGAAIVIVITLVLWLVLCGLSFSNQPDFLSAVCVYERCPETFWMINLKYRGQFRNSPNSPVFLPLSLPVMDNGFKMIHGEKLSMGPENVIGSLERQYRHSILNVQNELETTAAPNQTANANQTANTNGQPRYDFGLPMIGCIVMFVANFIFYVFSILIMWSYSKELQIPLYYEDVVANV